ncbi:MAG: polyprenyl synthetase family protein [Lachnospiraceae bacterium]|nr:polyprenyl synthetase family protein [Lachnospiraceae bacterium]MCI9389394.1 polyprenyl synthetase family protein [Lachnospiraceae bacterium]MCI9469954.1 polyprenyl synthetase family protein [Lachnospiraceae bacterium]
MDFERLLEEKIEKTEACINKYLPREEGPAKKLAQAMGYAMQAGGKRLRPLILGESYALFGGRGRIAEPFMAALEMIHTHSLIHDDLPALDNDDQRRGRKATHVVFGEAMGILSGDALLNYAYEVALHSFDLAEGSGEVSRVVLSLQILAAKTGLYGMLGGQSVDVDCAGRAADKEMLEEIYLKKTAALLEAAFMIGAVLAGATAAQIQGMEQAGRKFGLAFQIQDDILDVTGSEEELGKPLHSDEKNGKTTYVTIYGIEEAKTQAEKLSREAVELLEGMGQGDGFLPQLVIWLLTRKK